MEQLLKLIHNVNKEAEAGNAYECVMIASAKDPEIWLQITWNMINLSYPFANEPESQLKTLGLVLPQGTQIVEWEPQESATWEFDVSDPAKITEFALAYLAAVYGDSCAPEQLVIEQQEM